MNRREFSQIVLASSCMLPIASNFKVATAAAGNAPRTLNLTAATRSIEVNGRAATVFGLTMPDGKFGLDLMAGETVDVRLANTLQEETMIHWHGLMPAWTHDGVPDMPMPLLKADEVRAYMLPAGKPGTHWMHAHTLQEQALLAAPLVVRGADDLAKDEQDIVILLHDFSFTPATELLAKLKSSSGKSMMNMQGMDHSKMMGMDHSSMKSMMGMMGMDINDIEYDAYLANDRTLRDPQVTKVEKGGNIRLRIINGATATSFIINTGLLAGSVIAVDGQDIEPFQSQQFPLAMGQRVDFRLKIPSEGGAFPILALREGGLQRTGIILATAGASVNKLADAGDVVTPSLTLDMEADLVSLNPLDARPADYNFAVDLLGNMQGYTWGMESNTQLRVNQGSRVVVEMRNQSMMTHPMHLHGHHFQIININGKAVSGARRDTVIVPPMESVTFAFDALNPGKAWAFHCHHLYHMATGMMSAIGYEGA